MSIKSVKVNKKRIDIYDSDSNDTFLNRVAAVFKIHPNFIEEINIDELEDGNDIKVDTLIDKIQDYDYDEKNMDNNITFLSGLSENYRKNTDDTIVKLFLSVNPVFTDIVDFDTFELTELIPLTEALKNSDIDVNIDASEFLKKDDATNRSPRDFFMSDLKEKITIINRQTNELLEINREFAEMKSIITDMSSIDIVKDQSDFKIITNLKSSEYSLSSIFSNIVCKENAPFLSYNNLYKVYQDLDIKMPDDWSLSFPNFMILKVNIEDDKYTDCNIYFENNILTLSIDIKYSSFTHFSEEHIRELVKNRVRNCFCNFSDFSIVNESEINIFETVIIPDQTFNTYVLSDIVMNNNIFSKFLVINESVQTSKKKSGLYVHYFIKNVKGTCNITTAEDTSINPTKNIVRLRIKKAKDQDIAYEFINLIGKLMSKYNKDQKKIIEFYKKYIKGFPKEKHKKEVLEPSKITLHKQVPDLFISGYPYKCQYPPIIINDEEAKEYTEDRVMQYPIKGEGKTHNYVCNDEKNEYIYVGLRENTLKNRGRYKYIPCCFKSDQTRRRGPFSEYFKGEIVEKGPQQNIIITNKLVRNEEYGVLPKNLDKLLSTIDDSYNYLRKGVNSTNISFLDCVLESVLEIDDYSGLPEKKKLKILYKHYNDVKNYKYISVASQENPSEKEDKLRKELEFIDSHRDSSYLDPTRWLRLCEAVYKCKIVLFTRDRNEKDAFVTIPNHELIYLQDKLKDQKLVLIYEHYGTDIDMKYPKCELIIKWDRELTIEEGSTNNFVTSLGKKIYNFYTSIINQYYYDVFKKETNRVTLFDLTDISFLKPSHQVIDNYGKARGLVFSLDDDSEIILLSDPFPPIKAMSYEGNIYKNNNLRKVLEFINSNSIEIVSNVIVNESIKEVNMTISGIIFTAKIDYSEEYSSIANREMGDIESDIIEKYPSSNRDLSNNIRLKRLAFIISEYFCYFYSHYLQNKGEESSLEIIRSFIKNKVRVTEQIDYPYIISDKPSISLEILSENKFTDKINGKFLVHNNETLKRLVYVLRSQLINNRKNVLDYYKSNEVYNFYKETFHFSENTLNIIVKNVDDLQKIDNVIYDKLQTDKKKFFMHNELINNDSPILLKESIDKSEAFRISSNWIKYNKVSDYKDSDPLINRVMYLYNSEYNIKVNKDIVELSKNNSYALKYRKDKADYYLSLINL